MTIYRELLATTNQVGGDVLSEECLKKMAEQMNNGLIPVTLNYNHIPVGKITGGKITEEGLIATFDLCNLVLGDIVYLVPGIRVIEMHKKGDVRVIDEGKIYETPLVFYPADTKLTPVEKREDDFG
jgi:hypothetical protein